MPRVSPLQGLVLDGGRESEDEGTQEDSGGDRTVTSMTIGADSPSAHSLCAPKPQRDAKPTPRKEAEAEKRFGKKRLLIGLRYSSYRVALACQESGRHGTRGKYTGYKDTRDELLRDLCFYLYRRLSPALCLPTGEAAHSVLPRAAPCPPRPPRPPALPPAPARDPGLGTQGDRREAAGGALGRRWGLMSPAGVWVGARR